MDRYFAYLRSLVAGWWLAGYLVTLLRFCVFRRGPVFTRKPGLTRVDPVFSREPRVYAWTLYLAVDPVFTREPCI